MQTTLAPDFYGVFWAVVRTPADRRDRTAINDLTKQLTGHYELLDRQLATRPYLVGDRFSLADIAVGVTLYRYFEMEIERPALANLHAWYKRLRERPAFRDHVMISFEELRG
jgi:glutathione S-transferase